VSIEERLNYQFKSQGLLKEALSHPSLSSEVRPAPPDNQRLEYLGDAVLELTISNHLYHRFPDLREGPLTKLRSAVVSKPALAAAARRIDLGEALFLSNGEESSGGRKRDSNLADAFAKVNCKKLFSKSPPSLPPTPSSKNTALLITALMFASSLGKTANSEKAVAPAKKPPKLKRPKMPSPRNFGLPYNPNLIRL